jgi:hypothetical protein
VKDLLNRPGVQVALARILVAYLKFALGTTRWTLIGLEHLALPDRRPSVLAFWHQRLALIPALKTLARRSGVDPVVTVLTSRHRDGMLVSSVMEGFSLHVVNGSTAKAGQEKGGSAACLTACGKARWLPSPPMARGARRVCRHRASPSSLLCRVPLWCRAPRKSRGGSAFRVGTAWCCRCRSGAG